VGNLVLHLCGNVRQWLFSTLDAQEDLRQRQTEFDAPAASASSTQLKQMVKQLMAETDALLNRISSEQLIEEYRVQGFLENGVAILIHVTEHFSYHVGQMTYFVKAHKNLDLGYYAGQDLDKKN
jgi:uncharacterized damage-inducible protein DinB